MRALTHDEIAGRLRELAKHAQGMQDDLAEARRRALELEDQLALAQADSIRLDWVLTNRNYRVQGRGDSWHVMDCHNGLTFLVEHAGSAREAIDAARAKLEGRHE